LPLLLLLPLVLLLLLLTKLAPSLLHRYNTYLLRARALFLWSDPRRSAVGVAGLLLASMVASAVPLRWLWAATVLYYMTKRLRVTGRKGLTDVVREDWLDGIPYDSTTHANSQIARMRRAEEIRGRG
jgi:ABC-type uncharacterized transport system fused permease/ATPase subunit